MLAIVGWIVFGLIVGLIARAVMPGRDNMSLPVTVMLGILGALVDAPRGEPVLRAVLDPYAPTGSTIDVSFTTSLSAGRVTWNAELTHLPLDDDERAELIRLIEAELKRAGA